MNALAALPLVLVVAAAANDPPQKAPGPGAPAATVLEWTWGDGQKYRYRVPESYDHDKGANLVFVLHDANLDRRWGFTRFDPKTFRADDVVVCPDGGTSNGRGGFNNRHADVDLKKLEALHHQLFAAFKINATYVVGHGQGASFAFEYGGMRPDLVAGVVGCAGGAWDGTRTAETQKGQALALLHAAGDTTVPFERSAAALRFFTERGLPLVHLRRTPGTDHEPDPGETAQQLAWCEGMTSKNPDRVTVAFQDLMGVETGVDVTARHQVAARLQALPFAPDADQAQARATIATIDKRAQLHAQSIEKGMNAAKGKMDGGPWLGHLFAFFAEYAGLAPCEKLRERLEDQIVRHREQAQAASATFREQKDGDKAKAFVAGIDVIAKGWLADEYATQDLLATLQQWHDDAKALKIPATSVKYHDKIIPPYAAALAAGRKEFEAIESGE